MAFWLASCALWMGLSSCLSRVVVNGFPDTPPRCAPSPSKPMAALSETSCLRDSEQASNAHPLSDWETATKVVPAGKNLFGRMEVKGVY